MILFLILNIFCIPKSINNAKVVPVVFSSGRKDPTTYITFEHYNKSSPIYIYATDNPRDINSFKYFEKIKSKIMFKQEFIIFDLPLLPLKQIYSLAFMQDGQLYRTKPFVYSENNENYVFWTPFPKKENFSWVLFGISMGVILLFIIGLLYLVIVDDLRFC